MFPNISQPTNLFGINVPQTNSSQPIFFSKAKKIGVKKDSNALYTELLSTVPNEFLDKLPNELWYKILEHNDPVTQYITFSKMKKFREVYFAEN